MNHEAGRIYLAPMVDAYMILSYIQQDSHVAYAWLSYVTARVYNKLLITAITYVRSCLTAIATQFNPRQLAIALI